MDKGAHFHRCDFQVHTPRDAQWQGSGAVTDEERKAYAKELIAACREKGLDAIAISDHHDFTFFPYISDAASAEVDESGILIPPENQIVVFPALELTLATPACQAILVLDASFDLDRLNEILSVLTIDSVDAAESNVPTIEAISPVAVTSLNNLEDLLNQREWLKGKFIILPNVTGSGHKTILRMGFAPHFKEMRCVGGYIDGDCTKLGVGELNILNGKTTAYGDKRMGLFQTSDSRSRDHAQLGNHSTYVKWSEPTAEALRQACLAKESRLSQVEPQLPSLRILSLTVSDSKFLGPVNLSLNPQYNVAIGGRGTGKSTVLEYLRWGLCDQPIEEGSSDPVQAKRKSLIKNTLRDFNGVVEIEFLLNGVKHVVKRNSVSQEIFLKIGDDEFIESTEQQVRGLLPIQAYSQKQLSTIAVEVSELKRFIQVPIKRILDRMESEIRGKEAAIRSTYGNLVRARELRSEVDNIRVGIDSSEKQLIELRGQLKGLSDDDQKVIDQKAKYDEEESIIVGFQNQLEVAEEHVTNLSDNLFVPYDDEYDDLLGVDDEEEMVDEDETELQNAALIESIGQKYESKFKEIEDRVKAVSKLFDEESLKEVNEEVLKWRQLKADFDKKYEAAKKKSTVNAQKLEQIQILEKKKTELEKELAKKNNRLMALGKPEEDYTALRSESSRLYSEKALTLENQCEEFTKLSDSLIKAELKKKLNKKALIKHLKTAFASMNIQETKLEAICDELIRADDSFDRWNKILDELERLALHSSDDLDQVPETPILEACGLRDTELGRIAAQLSSVRWLELSLVGLEFDPEFFYCTNKDEDTHIDFSDASAGQQATALLTVLLNQSGAPLIIDQPEDDIDSKMVKDIIAQLWTAKTKRQLIFASHSANFVVNGDAELVVCFDYVSSGDQTRGHIKVAGAIDNEQIKDEITLVTEGGKDAFKLRMNKYGF